MIEAYLTTHSLTLVLEIIAFFSSFNQANTRCEL